VAPAAAAAAAVDAPRVMLPLSLEVLLQLHQLMWCHGEPQLRQLAFMLLQKLGAQPPTLYRCVARRAAGWKCAAAASAGVGRGSVRKACWTCEASRHRATPAAAQQPGLDTPPRRSCCSAQGP
jgi:hypothetical protein